MTASPDPERVVFATRAMRATDEAFLYSAFLSWLRESDYSDGIPNTEFYAHYKAEWAQVLAHFTVLVAHPEGAEDEIAGFIAYQGRTLALIYVKKTPWRHMGVAQMLLRRSGFSLSEPMDKIHLVRALYGSSRGLQWLRAMGYRVELCPHVMAVRALMGVAP